VVLACKEAKNMTGLYRLTFNKPAVAQLLHTDSGETADGLKVRINEDGVAQFMPVRGSKDGDTLRLEKRSRGGVEATVEGSMAEDIAAALSHDVGPFHTLKRAGQGWLETKPHKSEEAPSKFVPHVRLWDMGAKATKPAKLGRPKKVRQVAQQSAVATPATRGNPTSIGEMFDHLRRAKSTLSSYGAEKRRGQPPREVREAREALAAFQQAAVDFLPEISEAHAILHRIVERAGREEIAASVPQRRRRKATRKAKRIGKSISKKTDAPVEAASA
jgi:hypothetical protein